MKKVLTIFGTRPEAIKMAPVIKELETNNKFKSIVCVTGQHREMLDQALEVFRIKPDYDLNIMKPGQKLEGLTSLMLAKTHDVIKEISPDIVLVHGDTTTTFAAALAAFYNKTKIGHVEAGLRTGNKYSPFPEEMNRTLTGALADLHFAPTIKAKEQLLKEGVNEKQIFITGNTVVDALLLTSETINELKYQDKLKNKFTFLVDYEKCILITGHRRENFGSGFQNICNAIKLLSLKNPDVVFVYSVHMNPNIRTVVEEKLSCVKNIILLDPLNYEEFVFLMERSFLILTDSGGIQEEAPTFGIPVLVMRDSTERVEAIEAGVACLVGTSVERIFEKTNELINDNKAYGNMSMKKSPFGNGTSAKQIVSAIANELC